MEQTTKGKSMKLKLETNSDFAPQIIAYMKDRKMVAQIAFSKKDCDDIIRSLNSGQEYVRGPLSKTISLTKIASIGDLAAKLYL